LPGVVVGGVVVRLSVLRLLVVVAISFPVVRLLFPCCSRVCSLLVVSLFSLRSLMAVLYMIVFFSFLPSFMLFSLSVLISTFFPYSSVL